MSFPNHNHTRRPTQQGSGTSSRNPGAADSLTVPLPFPVSCVTGWLSLPEGATALLTEYGNDALVAMHLAVVSPDGRVLHTAPLGYRDPTSTYTQMQYTEGGFASSVIMTST